MSWESDVIREMKPDHFFTRAQLVQLLEACCGRTLGEVDVRHVFDRTREHPKITGIAGDVIEQSVLGYEPDSDQRPDIIVDGTVPTEVKTTGLVIEKKSAKKGRPRYEAKEPMSITAVSPETITAEQFSDSQFWHKLAHLLFVYYHYASPVTVPAAGYAEFPVVGFEFYEFSDEDRAILRADWELVRDFIAGLQRDYADYEAEYPRLSHELRSRLLYIDTAPKWPHRPRFRLKRALLTTIVQEHFGEKLQQLPGRYHTVADIDARLHDCAARQAGQSLGGLLQAHGLAGVQQKNAAEALVVHMFGGTGAHMRDVGLFAKAGVTAKSIILTAAGGHTEDMKLFPLDFDAIRQDSGDADADFAASAFAEWFQQAMLCVIFQEPHRPERGHKVPLPDVVLRGFKRLVFTDAFIAREVRPVWERIRALVNGRQLRVTRCRNKKGEYIINKSGTYKEELNFPKSAEGIVFVRGSGTDARKKPVEVNGIHMYTQYVWIRGDYIVKRLQETAFI